jgi:hypothetical protein
LLAAAGYLWLALVDCWKSWWLHDMHCYANMRGWRSVYEVNLIPCVYTVYSGICLKCSWLFTMKSFNESKFSHRTAKICNLSNKLLHDILGLTPVVNLIISFSKVNIFLLLDELLQKIIPHFITKSK